MGLSKDETLTPSGIEVVIGTGEQARTFLILPLVRKRYKKLFRLVGDIFGELLQDDEGKQIDLENILGSIPILVDKAGDKLGEIYSYVLDVDVAWIEENMLPAQEFGVFAAIIEQNDIASIVKNFKILVGVIQKGQTKSQKRKS